LPKNPIAYVEIRVFAHATEDENKVIKAVQNLLPEDHLDEVTFRKTNLKGHHGNPILLLQTKIKKKEILNGLIKKISKNLSEIDKEALKREFDRHLEKGSVFLRFDKQAAFEGEIKTCSADPIHVRLKFRKERGKEIFQICKEIGLLP